MALSKALGEGVPTAKLRISGPLGGKTYVVWDLKLEGYD